MAAVFQQFPEQFQFGSTFAEYRNPGIGENTSPEIPTQTVVQATFARL